MALVRLTHKISGHGHLSNKQRIKYSSLRLIRGAVLLGRAGQSILRYVVQYLPTARDMASTPMRLSHSTYSPRRSPPSHSLSSLGYIYIFMIDTPIGRDPPAFAIILESPRFAVMKSNLSPRGLSNRRAAVDSILIVTLRRLL